MLLYYYLKSSYREGKVRLFIELHSKRIRDSVNKLHFKKKIQLGEKEKNKITMRN